MPQRELAVSKWLKMNNKHLLTLQIWMEWRYRVWGATHKAILKPSSEAQNSFWIKISTWRRYGINFGRFKKSRVLHIVWQEYVNGDERHSKHLSLLKVVRTYSVFAVLISWDNFDNVLVVMTKSRVNLSIKWMSNTEFHAIMSNPVVLQGRQYPISSSALEYWSTNVLVWAGQM